MAVIPMHASLMAKQIMAVVVEEASHREATRVRSVDVEIGTVDGVRAEELREVFAVEAAGTAVEGATLNVHLREGRGLVIRSTSLVLGDD